jgi:hypothetical protein
MSAEDRKALYAHIIARCSAARPAPRTPDDEDFMRDRAYDACKVSDDEVREEAESWRR